MEIEIEAITVFFMLSLFSFSSFHRAEELCYKMAIAAVIVLHRRAEKSNFIDIQGAKER